MTGSTVEQVTGHEWADTHAVCRRCGVSALELETAIREALWELGRKKDLRAARLLRNVTCHTEPSS